jgi:hypothetical protein
VRSGPSSPPTTPTDVRHSRGSGPGWLRGLVGLARIELATSSLSGMRSNRLSYSPAVRRDRVAVSPTELEVHGIGGREGLAEADPPGDGPETAHERAGHVDGATALVARRARRRDRIGVAAPPTPQPLLVGVGPPARRERDLAPQQRLGPFEGGAQLGNEAGDTGGPPSGPWPGRWRHPRDDPAPGRARRPTPSRRRRAASPIPVRFPLRTSTGTAVSRGKRTEATLGLGVVGGKDGSDRRDVLAVVEVHHPDAGRVATL